MCFPPTHMERDDQPGGTSAVSQAVGMSRPKGMSLAPAHGCGGGRGCGMGAVPCRGFRESTSGCILVYPLACVMENHGTCVMENHGTCQHDTGNQEFLEFKVAALGTTFVAVLNCFTFYRYCQIFSSYKTQGETKTRALVSSHAQVTFLHPFAFTSWKEQQITYRMLFIVPHFLYWMP